MTANAGDNGWKHASVDTGTEASAGGDNIAECGSCTQEFKGCILHLFSGPHNRHDGFAAFLRKHGWQCDEYDIVNGDHENLASDHVWNKVLDRIKNRFYEAMLAGPPCNTFTNARKFDDAGPRPLRSAEGPCRYGLDDLSPEQREQVRLGNLLAIRTCEAALQMDEVDRPSLIEQPKLKEDAGSVSMFKLDEYLEYRKRAEVREYEVAQCNYGAPTSKPTTLLGCRILDGEFLSTCPHTPILWKKPSTGEQHWGPHPPLKGKEWYIPAAEWDPSMLKSPEERYAEERKLPFLTAGAQAYPKEFNEKLALTLIASTRPTTTSMIRVGQWKLVRRSLMHDDINDKVTTRQRMKFTASLSGRKQPDSDDELAHTLGGMRDPGKGLRTIPGYRRFGIKAYWILKNFLEDRPHVVEACTSAIGSEAEDAGPSFGDVAVLREHLMAAFIIDKHKVALPLDTELQAGLLWRLGRAAGDPDADEMYCWLTQGAPAGIEVRIEDQAHIFPPSRGEEEPDTLLVASDPAAHTNYSSVDGDPAAESEVMRLVATGFVSSTQNWDDFTKMIGGLPHFSKLGMITKEKDGRIKRRLILDCKESGVNKKAHKGGRLVLPRVTDVVDDALHLMNKAKKGQIIEWLILDFTDWFFNVPLNPLERKHFTIKYKSDYIHYLTQAQGSVNAPVVCGRMAAFVSRLTQAITGTDVMRLQTYVDDPCVCVLGNEQERTMLMAMVILFWKAIGIRLAFKKAKRGFDITWIGAQITAFDQGTTRAGVAVRAKQEIVDEVINTTNQHTTENVVSKKSLQSYVGKLNHIAGIVEMLRPFMADLYGALHKPTATQAPLNCLWTKQWAHVTLWIAALLGKQAGATLCREYRLSHYYGRSLPIIITTDACPWGLGGFLTIGQHTVACFTSALTAEDEQWLRIKIGESSSQQVAEGLAMLVALRIWKKYWQKRGVSLQVRSDSVSTLTLLAKLRVRHESYGLGVIARELALDFGNCSYKPRLLQHIPGIANDWADALSRQFQPSVNKPLPLELQRCRRDVAPERGQAYYMAHAAAKQST